MRPPSGRKERRRPAFVAIERGPRAEARRTTDRRPRPGERTAAPSDRFPGGSLAVDAVRLPPSSPLGSSLGSSSPEDAPEANRRRALARLGLAVGAAVPPLLLPLASPAEDDAGAPLPRGEVFEVEDPSTFSGVAYVPPAGNGKGGEGTGDQGKGHPLLVVLHGAGNNDRSASIEFTEGDHANLPPALLSAGRAPRSLSDNFVVVAPYARGKRSLYDEPRAKVLDFVRWFDAWIEARTFADGTSVRIDRERISLFGFSEGSILAVELATTRLFRAAVLCGYGFTGILPARALERLRGVPIWAFHSAGDEIYDVQCSERLVERLMEGGTDAFDAGSAVRFTKIAPRRDDAGEGEASGREHVRAALVASASGEVYSWLLSRPGVD
ncbi:hypothetical protein ACHAWF_001040 [Thalassiosira exigua]